MGNIFCCFDPKTLDQSVQRVDETTRLLSNKSDNNFEIRVWNQNKRYSDDLIESENYKRIDEQNNTIVGNCDKTVDNLASKLIDITTIDQPIDKMEFRRRQEMYERKVMRIENPLVLRSKVVNRSLTRDPIEYKPILNEDINLINDFALKSCQAIENGFRVHCEEPVVVPFDP